jgi:uncharacterized protein YegP (UPF0339 family)
MRFEYWKCGDGSWTWELRTSVNDVVARGCQQLSRENCLAAIKLVKLAVGAPAVDVTGLRSCHVEGAPMESLRAATV